MSGKGSKPRPFQVANDEYARRWDLIFGRDDEKENKEKNLESDRPADTCHNRSSDNSKGQTGQAQDA